MKKLIAILLFTVPGLAFAQSIDPADPNFNVNQTRSRGLSNQSTFKPSRTTIPGTYNRGNQKVLSNTGEYSGIYYNDLQGVAQQRAAEGDTVRLKYFDVNGRPIPPAGQRPATPSAVPVQKPAATAVPGTTTPPSNGRRP